MQAKNKIRKITKNIIINDSLLASGTDISNKENLILLREDQYYQLKDISSDNTKFLYGYPSTGKTTLVKVYLNEIKKQNPDAIIIYIDCRICDTPIKVVDKVFTDLASTFPEILEDPHYKRTKDQQSAIHTIIQGSRRQIYLVLDEIDKPMKKTTGTNKDALIHFFARETGNNFKFIFITNIIEINQMLSKEVLSVIRGGDIIFGVYNADEIYNILNMRAQLALLKGSYEEKDLRLIAKITYSDFDSDIREGLTLMRHVARSSEEKITWDTIENCREMLIMEKTLECMKGFPEGAQEFLFSLIINYRINGDQQKREFKASKKDLIDIYHKFCQNKKLKVRVSRSIYRYTQSLLQSGIIEYIGYASKGEKLYRFEVDPDRLYEYLPKIKYDM